jgi:hypothetical protein
MPLTDVQIYYDPYIDNFILLVPEDGCIEEVIVPLDPEITPSIRPAAWIFIGVL